MRPKAGVEAAGHRDVTMRDLRRPGSHLASVFPSVNWGAGASLAHAVPPVPDPDVEVLWKEPPLVPQESLPLHVCACVCTGVCTWILQVALVIHAIGPGFSILCLSLNFLLCDGTQTTPSEEWYRHRQGPLCASRLSVRIQIPWGTPVTSRAVRCPGLDVR